MTKEYGNYEKYDENHVKVKYDDGKNEIDDDKFYGNFINLIKRLPTKEAKNMRDSKREDISNMLTD